jgi:hypothetical protein
MRMKLGGRVMVRLWSEEEGEIECQMGNGSGE